MRQKRQDPKSVQYYTNVGYCPGSAIDGHLYWEFNEQQKELLQKYYDVNKLLVGCLNSAADVSSIVRQKIDNTLLLAIADIEKAHNSNN